MRGHPSLLRVALPSTVRLGLLLSGLMSASCGTSEPASSQPTRTIVPTIIGPENLISSIAKFTLTVYSAPAVDGGVSCTASTGVVANAPLLGFLAQTSTVSTHCTGGSTRCITSPAFPDSTTPDVVGVVGYGADLKTPIANGCAAATAYNAIATGNPDASVDLNITMVAVVAKETCGNGVIEPPETCDPGGNGTSGICVNCQTQEELLSLGGSGSNTVTGSPGDKSNPSFLWPLNGNFLAFFSDKSASTEQISMRILDDTLSPMVGTGVEEADSLYLPNAPNVFPPVAEAFDHKQPVAVQQGGYTYVAFADDSSGTFAIILRAMDASLNAQQGSPCAVGNSTGDPGNQTNPAMAVNEQTAATTFYIAWQDDSGNIFGRTYVPGALGACSTNLGTQTQLSTGGDNSNVTVAAVAAGWVVAWQSGGSVVARLINLSGNTVGGLVTIVSTNAAAPTVTALPPIAGDTTSLGPFAVAWVDQASASIYAARYNSKAAPLDGNGTQVSTTSNGGEGSPFIAAMPAANGSYVVTWVDTGSNPQVRARFLAGTAGTLANPNGTATPFLTNTIDGTINDFQVNVTTTSSRIRVTPTVAVGGSSSDNTGFIAFGWADNSTTAPFGIIARRFPQPTQ